MPWLRSIPERYQEEFEGLAKGANIPLQLVAEWCYSEVTSYKGCSTLLCNINGNTWVARNNDVLAPELWGYTTIQEITGRIPTMSFSLEADFCMPTGINRERLWANYNSLPRIDRPNPEYPCLDPFLFIAELLESCSSIDQVIQLLNEIQRATSMLLFVVDGKTNEFAAIECSCNDFRKLEHNGRWVARTNHLTVKELSGRNIPTDSDPNTTFDRLCRIQELVQELPGEIDETAIPKKFMRILADDRVEQRRKERCTVTSHVACPATGEIHYAYGTGPAASTGTWNELPWPW